MVEPGGMGGTGSPVPTRAISPLGKVIRTVPVKLEFRAISAKAGRARIKTSKQAIDKERVVFMGLGRQPSQLYLHTADLIAGIDGC